MSRHPTQWSTTTLSPTALFRFSVVSQVLARLLGGQVRARAVEEVAAREHATPTGEMRKVSCRTLYRWLAAYERHGPTGLEPRPRPRTESSVALPEAFVAFLRREKDQDSRASIPELIRRARERGVLDPHAPVDRTTVWRACRRMRLPTRRRPHKRQADTRRFAYPHRMMMVLADGKHFRAGATRQRRVALVFLDDATRYALHAVVGTSESTELFLRGLYELLGKVGYFDVVYLDRGPGFISADTQAVIAQLPHAHLVHGTAAYPQGRGKIERFNRTASQDVLRGLDGAAEIDADCGALELRLQHYLSRQYNERPHTALGGDSPRRRWERDPRALRFPDDDDELRRHFVITETRRVSPDHVIRYGGRLYEAPRGLAGDEVEVHRRVLDETLFVLHGGRILRLQLVDLAANATDRRSAHAGDESTGEDAPPKTAATLAFDRDFAPVIGPDGGFSDPHDPKE